MAIDEKNSSEPVESGLQPGERPTLKTISRITGLAVATVSRALNDAPDIGARTKLRVNAAASKIGYRPNRAGVRLRTGKTNVISLVLRTDDDIMNHTSKLISSIVSGLRGTPYHMIVTPYFLDEDPMTPIRYLVETGSADGLILNRIEPEDARVAYLMEHNIPFATHGRTIWADQHDYADFDNEIYGQHAVDLLAQRGRKSVLLIAPEPNQTYSQAMVSGVRKAAKEQGIHFDILPGATSDDPGEVIDKALLALGSRFASYDGIITASQMSALAGVDMAEQQGRTIGVDFDLVGKEAIHFLKRYRKEVIAVYEDVGTAGQFLAKSVIQRIANPKAPPMHSLDFPS